MKKSNVIKKVFIIIYMFFLCFLVMDVTKAIEPKLTGCTMSEEYKSWLDLSEEEKSKVMMPPYCDSKADKTNILVSSVTAKVDAMFSEEMRDTLPSKYDLRETEYKPVLKNQKTTGECWAFATTSILETVVKIKYGEDYEFSPRHIEYALTRNFKNGAINEFGYNRALDTGGNYHMSASYLVNNLGPVLESDMPFKEDVSPIDISEIDKNVTFDVNDIILKIGTGRVACSQNEINIIKNYIYQYGAVATSSYMVLTDNYYNKNTGAYYYNGNNPINHAITIIGWDDNYSRMNFSSKNRPKADGAWIVQNSYGTSNGIDGYNFISYEDVHTCDLIMAITDIDKEVEDNAYIYDKLGYNRFFGYVYGNTSSTEAYAMNIFTKKSGKKEILKEITIGSNGTGNYKIYYMKGKANNKAISDMTLIGSGRLIQAGYATHKLDNPIYLNDDVTDYSIAVYYKMDTSTMPITVSGKDSNRYSPVAISAGKTFASANGSSWTDLSNYSGEVLIASIKAFTDDANHTIDIGEAKVTEGTQYYDVNIEFNYSNIDTNKLDLVLTNSDGVEYNPDIEEIYSNRIYLGIDKNRSGESTLTIYYDGNYVGEVKFFLNKPLNSNVYTIDQDKMYIFVPPNTNKSIFISNISGLTNPSSIGSSGYMYTGMIVENYTIVVKGDISGDGLITPLDYIKIKNHIMATELIRSDVLYTAADYNDDSSISPLDYVKVKNYIMNGE